MALKHRGIIRIGYVRLAVRTDQFAATCRFYKETLGLIESAQTEMQGQFHCWHEPTQYSVLIDAASDTHLIEIGFQVRDVEDIADFQRRVTECGIVVTSHDAGDLPGLSASISFTVPEGPTLRLFHAMNKPGYVVGNTSPDWVVPKSVRGTPAPMFLNHVGLTSGDPVRTIDFLVNILGFHVSEKMVSDDGKQLLSALLFRMSKNVGGQELAIFPGKSGRLHHIAFTKDDASEILVDGQYLRSDGVDIDIMGPTRQPYGNTFSLHFRDPNGIRLELCSGGRMTVTHREFQPVVWTESNSARAFAYYDDQLETGFLAHSL